MSAAGSGPWPDLKMLKPEEFAASIERQLLDLERREAVPRVLPHAIRAFGLTPQSSADEIAVVQWTHSAAEYLLCLFAPTPTGH